MIEEIEAQQEERNTTQLEQIKGRIRDIQTRYEVVEPEEVIDPATEKAVDSPLRKTQRSLALMQRAAYRKTGELYPVEQFEEAYPDAAFANQFPPSLEEPISEADIEEYIFDICLSNVEEDMLKELRRLKERGISPEIDHVSGNKLVPNSLRQLKVARQIAIERGFTREMIDFDIVPEIQKWRNQGIFVSQFDPETEEKLTLNSYRQWELTKKQVERNGLTREKYYRQQQLIFEDLNLEKKGVVPPILAGETFDPQRELDRIKQLPIDESKRALEEFEEKLAYQEEGWAYFRERCIQDFFNDPLGISLENFLEILNLYGQRHGFSDGQKETAVSMAEKFFSKTSSFKTLRTQYSDDHKLVEMVFGREIKNEVVVFKAPFLIVQFMNNDDLRNIYSDVKDIGKLRKIGETEQSSEVKIIPKGVMSVTRSGIPFIALRSDVTDLDRLHELQHFFHSFHNGSLDILCPDLDKKVRKRHEVYELAVKSENDYLKKGYFRDYLFGARIAFSQMAKNEIFAFEKGQTHPEEIIRVLTKKNGSEYDYGFTLRQNTDKIISALGEEPYRQMVIKEINQMTGEYDLSIKEAINAFEELKKNDYSVDQAIQIVTFEPLHRWGKKARRHLDAKKRYEKRSLPHGH